MFVHDVVIVEEISVPTPKCSCSRERGYAKKTFPVIELEVDTSCLVDVRYNSAIGF